MLVTAEASPLQLFRARCCWPGRGEPNSQDLLEAGRGKEEGRDAGTRWGGARVGVLS